MLHEGRRDFRRLWAALTVSLMGSEITALALALFAALVLGASPFEMGLLAAATQVPFLLFSLPAGAWIDRLRRRPMLIATDIAAALLLVSIPLTVPFGGPTFAHVCLVAFGTGTVSVVAEIAHYAYVPVLVGRENLAESNSRLQASYSVTGAAGPGLAGLLVQLVSAPIAVLVDAASFLVSAALLKSIRHREPAPAQSDADGSLVRSVVDGMRFLIGHALLRPIIITSVPIAFFGSGFLAIYVLYVTRELGLDAGVVGLIFAAGGVGAVLGAVSARSVAERIGLGPTIIGGWTLAGATALVVPLATGPAAVVIVVLALVKAAEGATMAIANVHQWTLRQAVTPDAMAGRVTASHRFTVYGAGAIGALAGGLLASLVGPQATLLVCAVGATLTPLLAVPSALRRLRAQPAGRELT